MPRNLTANAISKVANKFGNEPITLVGVFWNGTQEIRYADRDISGIAGRILEIGEIDDVIKIESSNSNASVNITLDDTTGDIKQYFNTIDLHKKKVVVYQHFDGMALGDAFIVMTGQINSPVIWDERERKITFTVLSKIEENQTGFAPEEGQFTNVNSKFIGKAWPLAFGDVMHIPAVKITEQPRGVSQTLIGVPDYTLPYKYWNLVDRLTILRNGYNYYQRAIQFLDTISREPSDIIREYIEAILQEDPRKQRHEDLSTFIVENDKVVEQLHQLLEDDSVNDDISKTVYPSTINTPPSYQGREGPVASTLEIAAEQVLADRQAVQDKADELTNRLDDSKEEIYQLNIDLQQLSGIKELLKIETSNAEYAFKNIAQIAKKIQALLINLIKTQREIEKIVTIMKEHEALPQNTITVIGGENFPQNTQIRIGIGGMTYAGKFNGREFTATGYEPRYENLRIAGREDDQVDAFWLEDDSVNIKGHYCVCYVPLTPSEPEWAIAISGAAVFNPITKVFKVIDQIGRKCIIELVEMAPSIRLINQQPQLPLLEDLPQEIWNALQYAQEYTTQEKQRMLENAIEKYQREDLDRIKSTLEKLKDIVFEATYDDEVSAVNDTILNNVHEYNSKVTQLSFTQEVIEKVTALISEEEFNVLLRLCNLHLRRTDQDYYQDIEIPNPRVYYITGFDITNIGRINATSPVTLPQWLAFQPNSQTLTNDRDVINLPNNVPVITEYLPTSTLWFAEPGSEVALITDTSEKYIANILPSTVKAVYGWKAVNGIRQLLPIPRAYYIKNENDTSYPPLTCTTITLRQPLKNYEGEDWEDSIYVSLISSEGPNTIDIIEHILTTYTNIGVDAISFTDVAGKIANFPSHFCLFEKKETLQLIQDIAWQARCSVWVNNGVAYVRYLSETPTPIATLSASDALPGTFQIEYTNTEDLVTKFVAEWLPDYSQEDTNKIVLRYNLPKYGEVEQNYNFFIYNIEELVNHSATFWMIRKANTWKRVRFNTPLHKMAIETMDAVTLSFAAGLIASGDIVAVAEKAQYDSANNTMSFEFWTGIRAGEMTTYDYAWPANLDTNKMYPSVDEINLGYAGSPHSNVPKDSSYRIDPNRDLIEQLNLRPHDYGEVYLADARFVFPTSPLLGLSEQDYLRIAPGEYTLPDQPRTTESETKPVYGAPIEHGLIKDDKPRQIFMGRVIESVAQSNGMYTIKDTNGDEFEVHQFSGDTDLEENQAITVIYDELQQRYITNDVSSSTANYIVINQSGEVIEPYSAMEITGNRNGAYTVTKPTKNSLQPAKVLFNMNTTIGIDSEGIGYTGFDSDVQAYYDKLTDEETSEEIEPVIGDKVGTQKDSFRLKHRNRGFMFLSEKGGARALMRPFRSTGWYSGYSKEKTYPASYTVGTTTINTSVAEPDLYNRTYPYMIIDGEIAIRFGMGFFSSVFNRINTLFYTVDSGENWNLEIINDAPNININSTALLYDGSEFPFVSIKTGVKQYVIFTLLEDASDPRLVTVRKITIDLNTMTVTWYQFTSISFIRRPIFSSGIIIDTNNIADMLFANYNTDFFPDLLSHVKLINYVTNEDYTTLTINDSKNIGRFIGEYPYRGILEVRGIRSTIFDNNVVRLMTANLSFDVNPTTNIAICLVDGATIRGFDHDYDDPKFTIAPNMEILYNNGEGKLSFYLPVSEGDGFEFSAINFMENVNGLVVSATTQPPPILKLKDQVNIVWFNVSCIESKNNFALIAKWTTDGLEFIPFDLPVLENDAELEFPVKEHGYSIASMFYDEVEERIYIAFTYGHILYTDDMFKTLVDCEIEFGDEDVWGRFSQIYKLNDKLIVHTISQGKHIYYNDGN